MVAKFQGQRVNGTAVPLFGSRQYDKALNSAGMRSTRAELGDGLAELDCAVTYELSNRTPAMATIFHGLQIPHW